jgi:ferrochelatase
MKWVGPSTEEVLEKAAKDGIPVVILPHAFTQEHVETLVEIELEYREAAEHMGITGFYRVPTVGVHPDFIAGLAQSVLSRLDGFDIPIAPDTGARLCPKEFCRCAMQDLKPLAKKVA